MWSGNPHVIFLECCELSNYLRKYILGLRNINHPMGLLYSNFWSYSSIAYYVIIIQGLIVPSQLAGFINVKPLFFRMQKLLLMIFWIPWCLIQDLLFYFGYRFFIGSLVWRMVRFSLVIGTQLLKCWN